MPKTKKQYENYLNELYSDAFSFSEALDNFSYWNNGKITGKKLCTLHANRMLGTALRKYDPIAFNVGYGDWSR